MTTFVKKKPFSSSHLANASAMQATSPSVLPCNDGLETTSVSNALQQSTIQQATHAGQHSNKVQEKSASPNFDATPTTNQANTSSRNAFQFSQFFLTQPLCKPMNFIYWESLVSISVNFT
jgi:hypothetical protein